MNIKRMVRRWWVWGIGLGVIGAIVWPPQPALMRAVKMDSVWLARWALWWGANPNYSEWRQHPFSGHGSPTASPMHHALRRKNHAMISLLLDHGANNGAAVDLAIRQRDPQLLDLLLAHGVQLAPRSMNGEPRILLAAENPSEQILTRLLRSGIAIDEPVHHRTALCMVVELGFVESVRLLLKHGANPHVAAMYSLLGEKPERRDLTPLEWTDRMIARLEVEAQREPALAEPPVHAATARVEKYREIKRLLEAAIAAPPRP